MENIKNYLLENYNALSYTHNYIFGISYKKMIYAITVENAKSILSEIVSVEKKKKKNGGGYSLKFLQNKEKIAILFSHSSEIIPICSLDYFENLVKYSRLNRGQMFENLVISYYHADTPEKKNAKFTDCGDCIINGKHYQIKYHKATFTNETTLQNLLKR